MRASKSTRVSSRAGGGTQEIHVSGAEGLYTLSDIPAVARLYIERALHHPKGRPGKIVITAELMQERPRIIPALPVTTVASRAPDESRRIVREILSSLSVGNKALQAGFAVIRKGAMRGASLISIERGTRLEPDRQRGVRVSRIGITPAASKRLSHLLARHGINTETVKEALVIASKVISHKDVIAELCVSDDPDYTTGYVASGQFGYVRIPNIKPKKSATGGRAFYVREGTDITGVMNYLETAPVLISKASRCKGTLSLHEILNNPDR
jgi:6-carboxyhexanoate--CoA ligase